MTRKIIAGLVLVIFMLSVVPMALANEVREDVRERGQQLKEQVEERLGEEKDELVQEAKRRARNRILEEVDRRLGEEKRPVKERFARLKVKHKELTDKMNTQRERFARLKAAAKDCQENCGEKLSSLKQGLQKRLAHAIDVKVSSLAKLQDRIEVSEKLTDEEKEHALATLNELIAKLDDIQAKVAEIDGDTANTAVKETIREMKAVWREISQIQKQLVQSVVHAKQGTILGKLDKIGERLQHKIDQMDGDTTAAVELKEKFLAQVEVVKAAHAKAREVHQLGDRESFKEVQEEFKQELQTAKEILREFTSTTNEG